MSTRVLVPGRFPLNFVVGRKLNLGSGLDVRPRAEGWVNLDGFVKHPEVEPWDFTRTPWPFEDGAFDYILARHVIEHVPQIFEEWKGVRRDVMFAIMEEAHRVLRPGGCLHIFTPQAGSPEDFSHLQHYRHVDVSWQAIFDPREPDAANYSSAKFELAGWRRNPLGVRGGHRWLIRGVPLLEHIRVRVPPLRNVLAAKNELEMLWRRPGPGKPSDRGDRQIGAGARRSDGCQDGASLIDRGAR